MEHKFYYDNMRFSDAREALTKGVKHFNKKDGEIWHYWYRINNETIDNSLLISSNFFSILMNLKLDSKFSRDFATIFFSGIKLTQKFASMEFHFIIL